MPSFPSRIVAALLLIALLSTTAWPWGSEGHTAINRAAALALPADVPVFLRGAIDQLGYLGPEPDRWREKTEIALKLAQEPDHFINLERVEGLEFPPDRYSYYRALQQQREQTPGHPDNLLPEKVGSQPYIVIEVYERLITAFREYRHALRDRRNPDFAARNAVFYAGWLGHYVADGANPLHTTIQYNGWTGANPNGYTTANTMHWKMEGQFVAANLGGLNFISLMTGPARKLSHPFADYLIYLRASHALVEKSYQLEKAGGFDGAGTPDSREFIRQRLAAGALMLRDLWYTAWLESANDPPESLPRSPGTPVPSSPPPPMRTTPSLQGTTPPQPGL